jgi:DNA-binding transcriptional LysR family regulator
MDLRTLRYFIAVLEAGSLSRAAGSLYIAQPALTAQIKKLEGELGAQLFERSHVGVTPTPAGLQLYQDARRLLSDADAMRDRIQRVPEGPEGSVTVAAPFLLAALLLGPVLAALRLSHPRIRVFVLDDLSLMVKKAMVERRADVGILVDAPLVDGLRCEPLACESIFLCGRDADGTLAPRLRPPRGRKAARPEIDFELAARLPLVLQSRRFSIRQRVEDAAATLGVTLNVVHEQDSARVIRSLYVCGAGFTFTPACTLGDTAPGSRDWIVARVVRPELQRSYFLATPSDRTIEPATSVVMDALAEQTARLIRDKVWDARLLSPS